MSDQTPFPTKPLASITKDEVVDYLLQHQRRGYQIFQLENGGFELKLDDSRCIRIMRVENGKTQVQSYAMNNVYHCFDCESLAEVERAVDVSARNFLHGAWQQSPGTGRLNEDKPATNLTTISRLVGSSSIEAIFDPYLENQSLAAVIDILSFGSGSVGNDIRVLSTDRKTVGKIPRLTRSGFKYWLQQVGVAGELRIMKPSEHRRFFLLSSGQSLLLGPSLNSLHKNEAVRLESDAVDKAFFEQVWAQSTPLS